MKKQHRIMGLMGLVLLLASVWQIAAAGRGLEISSERLASMPLTAVYAKAEPEAARPLVLIGHGFSGSQNLMRGFALSLAHAGYTVVLWDFDGHGANPQPLNSNTRQDRLLANANAALARAEARGWGDPDRVAILGHSMGSGVALSFGQAHPDTAAVIAVSPVGQPVTPELPQNLLLLAGSLEPPFVRNAEERLAEAGGPGGDPASGTARRLLVVPNVEHISILFSSTAHAAAREWLDLTFGPQPGAEPFTDRRLMWYVVGLAGTLLVAAALAPLLGETAPVQPAARPLWWRLGALAGGALMATVLLWLASQAGLGAGGLLGIQVGGYLLVWFGLAGLVAQLILWVLPSRPTWRALLSGLVVFAALWLGVGLLGQWVWLPWLLIPRRLALWLPGALLLLPWFLAAGTAMRGASHAGRAGWWLAHSVVLFGAMFLALQLNPELYFLILILPLFPVILGLQALAAAPYRGAWPYALSGALFVSWLLLAVFPLS